MFRHKYTLLAGLTKKTVIKVINRTGVVIRNKRIALLSIEKWFLLTPTLAVQLDRYACGTSANGRSVFF